ncbi:MAG: serine hydrolase [Phenylobacterium sp.]|uniref:serine hydrolase domain-containing protein n=1 Tax=Phenylobacterium sp. TaxID=1871053 RepID=UPI0025CE890D|nr:serine hydrolase domain-containing protein [Phenylobacterium sp.]MBI1197214.1 serine hydrolase [Phenylobacterium sp.]
MSRQNIQDLIEAAVAKGVAPGLTAAVARPDGTDELFAAGVRGAADPTPMDAGTVFWIASCTKALTSAAALELVAQGRLDLDEPVGGLVPALAAPQVLEGFDADGAPRLRPARKPVTLRTLLAHTSGMAYDFFNADLARHLAAVGGDLSLAVTGAAPLVFEPGEGWQYGTGIDGAAWLIEAATGEPFAAYLARTILDPLGMSDTAFAPGPDQAVRRAGMHHRTAEGAFAPADAFPAPPAFHGGGGLTSTAADYLKFLRAVIGDGAGVLSPETLERLRQPQARVGRPGDLATAAPPLSSDFRPMPGIAKSWTLGFLRNDEDVPGGRRAGSLAWGGLANCYYWADPASGVAGVLCAQFLPFADPGVLKTFEAFEQAVYAS